MRFQATIFSVKTMQDGGIRVAIDVPETDMQAVLSELAAYQKKALMVTLDSSASSYIRPEQMVQVSDMKEGRVIATNPQKAKIALMIKDIAEKYGTTAEETKLRLKKKFFPGNDEISIADMDDKQASFFIDCLQEVLDKKAGPKHEG